MKERVERVKGCDPENALAAVDALPGTIDVFLEGFFRWVNARVEVWGTRGSCRLVRVKFVGLRIWSEVFEICVSGADYSGEILVIVRRRGGVGRLNVDFIVSLVLNKIFELCPEAEVIS